MTRPARAAFMAGMQYFAQRKAPFRLMPITRSQVSSGISSIGAGLILSPALLIRMLTGRPEVLGDGGHGGPDLRAVGDINLHQEDLLAALTQLRGERLGSGLALVVAARHSGAEQREAFDHRRAEARRAAGNHHHLAIECLHLLLLVSIAAWVNHHFKGLPGLHQIKALVQVFQRNAMRDDRRRVDLALRHQVYGC